MISKKFMLMAVFLVSLLAVSAVSANEINTTGEVAIDDGDLITAEVSEDISADSQEDVLNAKDDGTFTALQKKINSTSEGSTITLENDYKYDEGFDSKGIDIDKPVTIDGKGYTIDANSKARIFNIGCSGVVLNNINFKNAYLNDWDAEGCAIYAYGGLTLNHCNFMNNNIDESCTRYTGQGGVIFTKNRLNLNDCVFNENYGACSIITTYQDTSGSYGHSGRNYDLNINNCVFDSNKGDYIIYATDTYNLMVNNSLFTYSESSVIDAFKSSVYNSRFENNGGAAISVISTSVMDLNNEIVNCSFIGNSFGGIRAFHNFYTDEFNLKVSNCDFIDNVKGNAYLYAVGRNCDGGAIYGSFIGSMLEVDNCRFINNFAYDRGGAIYNTGGTVVKNSEFRYNNAMNGGGIYNCEDQTTVTNCIFEKNYADKNGTAMYGGNAIGCTFIDSTSDYDNLVFKGTTTNCIFKTTVSINADDVNKYYGESKDFIVILATSDGALSFKDVKITVNDKTSTVKTDSNGKASIPLNLPVGTHNVVVEYEGVSKTSKVTVKSTITASDMTGTYSNSKATATFLDTAGKALASKLVTFKIGTSSYAATTDSNGVASADIPLGVNTYTVTAVNPTTKEERQFKLTISKASSTTRLTAVQNGKSVTLTAALTPSAATGKVTFEINGKTKQSSISNGKASATFTDLSPNTYPATATYGGDANYKTSSKTASVKVDKVYSIVDVGDVEGFYLDSKVSATFLDANGKALANTKVTFKAGGKSYPATTNSKGAATANIDLDVGTYNVTAVNPDTKEEKQFKLTITKPDAKIVPLNLNAEYASGTFTFKLVDSNTNKPLAGKKLSYTIITGGANTGGSVTTDANGIATLDNTNLKVYKWENGILSIDGHIEVGKQLFSIKVDDSSISASEIKGNFTVTQAKINININPYSEYYGSNKKVVIDVTNAKTGDPMKGIDIHLYMANTTAKDYYFQTGDDGTAQINVSGLVSGEYSLTVSNNDTKNIKEKKVSGVITVLGIPTKITVTAPNTCYCNSENTVTVKITDKSTGEAVANAIVLVQPNAGKTSQGYIYQTNGDGLITFSYAQAAAGSYKLVFTMADTRYSASSVTKTITVKHLVTLKTVTVKKSAKKLVLQATLGKVNGKYLNKKKVTFKFNGKKYTAKTNNKGVAKVTIKSNVLKKLKVGKKITYQATYSKDTVKKTVKVKK